MGPSPINDHVTDAKMRIGAQFVESVFYRAALEHGFGRGSEDRAQALMLMWTHGGFNNLPQWCKAAILRYCDMETPPKAA